MPCGLKLIPVIQCMSVDGPLNMGLFSVQCSAVVLDFFTVVILHSRTLWYSPSQATVSHITWCVCLLPSLCGYSVLTACRWIYGWPRPRL